MRYRTQQSLIGITAFGIFLAVCMLLKFLTSPVGKFLIGCTVVLLVIFVIVRLFCMDMLYEKFSTKLVQKKFVKNNTALRNVNCTVNLTSGKQITVMENNFGPDDTKKMFVVTNKDTKINQSWYKICRTFDAFSSLASLAAFYNLEMINVNIITYDTQKKQEQEIEQETIAKQPEPQPQTNPEPPQDNEGRIVDF